MVNKLAEDIIATDLCGCSYPDALACHHFQFCMKISALQAQLAEAEKREKEARIEANYAGAVANNPAHHPDVKRLVDAVSVYWVKLNAFTTASFESGFNAVESLELHELNEARENMWEALTQLQEQSDG